MLMISNLSVFLVPCGDYGVAGDHWDHELATCPLVLLCEAPAFQRVRLSFAILCYVSTENAGQEAGDLQEKSQAAW